MPDPSFDDVTSELPASSDPGQRPQSCSWSELEKDGRWEEVIASPDRGGGHGRQRARAAALLPAGGCRLRDPAATTPRRRSSPAGGVRRGLRQRGGRPRTGAGGRAQGRQQELIAEYEALAGRGGGRRPEGGPATATGPLARAPGRCWRRPRPSWPRRLQVEPASMAAVRAQSDLLSRQRGLEDAGRAPGPLGTSAAPQAGPGRTAAGSGRVAPPQALGPAQPRLVCTARCWSWTPIRSPALEGLVEITWDDENWVRALPLLERLAASPGRAPRRPVAGPHQRAALAALRTGDDQRARSHAAQVPDAGSRGDQLRARLAGHRVFAPLVAGRTLAGRMAAGAARPGPARLGAGRAARRAWARR